MMSAIGLLLACQLAGESLTRLFGWPVPGPVLGLVFLFLLLLLRDQVSRDASAIETTPLGVVSGFLLANLSLMFVPAGVGIVQEWATLQRDGLGLLIALIVSTALALMVTGFVFQKLAARFAPERDS
jgi:holin-like protein